MERLDLHDSICSGIKWIEGKRILEEIMEQFWTIVVAAPVRAVASRWGVIGSLIVCSLCVGSAAIAIEPEIPPDTALAVKNPEKVTDGIKNNPSVT